MAENRDELAAPAPGVAALAGWSLEACFERASAIGLARGSLGDWEVGRMSERWDDHHEQAQHASSASPASKGPGRGRLLIPCPHCGTRLIAVAKRTWFVYGFVLFARFGEATHVGCVPCVNRLVMGNLIKCLLFGWWSFPWGLATPLALLQNLLTLSVRPPGILFDVLKELEIDPEQVLVDERGLPPGLRRFLDAGAALIAAIVWSDEGKEGTVELRAGTAILQAMSDGILDVEEAEQWIRAARGRAPDLSVLDGDGRALLFRIAADVASADGALSAAELRVLYDLGTELGFNPATIRQILQTFYGTVAGARSREADPEILRACEILGVRPDTPLSEVRRRYRSLMMLHHPDRGAATGLDERDAHRAAQRLNWAYQVLVTAGTGDADGG